MNIEDDITITTTITIRILQMGKRRLREVESLAQLFQLVTVRIRCV